MSGSARLRPCHVVIIGGGLAGLSAAEAIARLGNGRFTVDLLEAKRMTGGRAGSFQEPSSGQTVDYCQHVAMGCCTNLIGLLSRYGLDESLHRYTELEFHHPSHPPSRFAASAILPPPLHLAGAIRSLRYLSGSQKRSISRAIWRLMRTPGECLVDQTAGDWLGRQRQDADTIAQFWDVVLVSALGEKTDVVSMAAARKVFIDGFAAARGASDVLVPKRPLSDLFGHALPEAIGKLGVRIVTAASVTQVQARPEQGATVALSDGRTIDADHLISAVPWHAVDGLLSTIPMGHPGPFSEIPSSPITGMHLWFDREITQRPHAVMVGTTAQWLFRQPHEGDRSQDGHYYQVVISASSDHRTLGKEALVARVVEELTHAFPQAAGAQLLGHRVVTDPNSVFSVSPEVERLRPPARTALPWLHLAGDWIATGWPATMEGAVISGAMAADSVMQSEDADRIDIDQGLPRGGLARLMIA